MQINSNKKKIFCWKTFGWACLVVFVLFLLLSFPVLFNFFAIHFWHVPESELSDFTKLGPLGDIYGSLNAFVSSVALCAVAYSTWLQITAIKQTKDATNEQLTESRNMRLTDQFYALMTFKNEMLYQLRFKCYLPWEEYIEIKSKTKNIDAFEALKSIAGAFKKLICIDDNYLKLNYKERLKVFEVLMGNLFAEEVNELVSYFYIYGELIKMINNAQVSENIKENLKSVLRNTMLQEEQIVLFFFASIFKEINLSLKDSEIFNKFHYPMYHKFALKFHNESHFKSDGWKEIFRNNQTQPELGLFD